MVAIYAAWARREGPTWIQKEGASKVGLRHSTPQELISDRKCIRASLKTCPKINIITMIFVTS
jgi:hypothetical protein